jgi:hypothetical protein
MMKFGKSPVFWRNISPSSSRLKSKPSKKSGRSRWQALAFCLILVDFLCFLLLGPEDGGNMFLQNTGLSAFTQHYNPEE